MGIIKMVMDVMVDASLNFLHLFHRLRLHHHLIPFNVVGMGASALEKLAMMGTTIVAMVAVQAVLSSLDISAERSHLNAIFYILILPIIHILLTILIIPMAHIIHMALINLISLILPKETAATATSNIQSNVMTKTKFLVTDAVQIASSKKVGSAHTEEV